MKKEANNNYDPEKYAYGKYTKTYRQRNPEKHRYYSYKSTTKTFIRRYATVSELEELKTIIEERRKELKE